MIKTYFTMFKQYPSNVAPIPQLQIKVSFAAKHF